MSLIRYRNHREFMGYRAGTVFRLLFETSVTSIQLSTPTPPGVFLLNEEDPHILNTTKEDFEELFRPASWEWVPEKILLKEKSHGVKIGWLVKKKEVPEHNAKFWHQHLKVVGFHRESGAYAEAVNGGVYNIPHRHLLGGMFTITPNIEDND